MKAGPRTVWHQQEEWILAHLPQGPCRLLERARQRGRTILACKSFEEVYAALPVSCQISPDGIPHYPDDHFDALTSIDVPEHVDSSLFEAAAAGWYRITKPGGRFLARWALPIITTSTTAISNRNVTSNTRIGSGIGSWTTRSSTATG